MTITKFKICNYKSHSNTEMEFDKVTSIIGSNDSGKSSILKALKMLLFNGNFPVTHVRNGVKWASIEATTDSGSNILRTSTKGKSAITITKNGVKNSFIGKRDVNAFIEKETGVRLVQLEEGKPPENLNYVGMNETAFLINESAQSVQKKISSIIGASDIEDAKNRLSKEYKELIKERDGYDLTIASSEPEIKTLELRLDNAKYLLDSIKNVTKSRDELAERIKKLEDCTDIHSKFDLLETTTSMVEYLTEKANIIYNKMRLCETAKKLAELKEIPTTSARETINKIEEVSRKLLLAKYVLSLLADVRNLENTEVCPYCGK